jgi:hypothetical protein
MSLSIFICLCQLLIILHAWTQQFEPTYGLCNEFTGTFAKLQKKKAPFSVMSVRPSARNNSAPTGRIFMKFDI